MYLIVLLYCALYGSWSVVADNSDEVSVQTTDVFGFVGIGYNILSGNPEGDFNIGGLDPGFKLAREIFKRTYDEGKTAVYEGEEIAIPDQMEYQSAYSCSSVETSYSYIGAKSYQDKLSINVKVKGKWVVINCTMS